MPFYNVRPTVPSNQVRDMASLSEAVRRANIIYDPDSFQTGIPHVPPYLSSGILGGCFGRFGFMERPDTGTPEGRTVLGYTDHYYRVAHGRHVQLPLGAIQASYADGSDIGLVECNSYRQELDLLTGVLETAYDAWGPTRITAFASQSTPNLLAMRIDRKASEHSKQLIIRIECEPSPFQNRDLKWPTEPLDLDFTQEGNRITIRSTTNCKTTRWTVDVHGAQACVDGTAVVVRVGEEPCVLKVLVDRPNCPDHGVLERSWEELLEQHADAMRRFWEECWVDLPDDRAHKIWTRTNYYLSCTMPTVAARPMCPTGVLSNIWGFYFPQDVYYVVENAPRLGHLDRARTALGFWLEHLPDVQEYCRRIMGVDGAYYPWTPPYQDWHQYEADGVTSADSYELHNSAYVVAMVWHYYLLTGDQDFLRDFLPVITEVFRFYRNIASLNDAGRYDIYHEHARGQDEHSSTAGRLKNLICAGYSAEYCARAVVAAHEAVGGVETDLLEAARDMAERGCERRTLLRPEGIYATYEGDDRPLGSQKHPPQLNPIAYLPMPDMLDSEPAVAEGWRRRYDLTERARRPHTCGWTYGEFLLASVRMRAPQEAARDLAAVQPCRAADPRWIQFYESSYIEGWHLRKAYYFTMSGLYLQAFTDCLVQDWRGYVDLFPCLLPGWAEESLEFRGVHARGGIVVDGCWNKGTFEVELRPHGTRAVDVRVSAPGARIEVTGHASGPDSFESGQVVSLAFDGDAPIKLGGRA